MANFVGGVISLTLAVIMVSAVLIPQVKNTNTSTWSTSEVALFGVITLVSIAGIVYGAGNMFGILWSLLHKQMYDSRVGRTNIWAKYNNGWKAIISLQ